MKIKVVLIAVAAVLSATSALALPGWMIDKAVVTTPQARCFDPNAKPEQTVASCTAVLRQIQPEQQFGVLYSRADAYVALERYEDAIADLDAATSLEPDQAFLFALRCRARSAWGQELDKALADCDAAIRVVPDDSKYLNLRCIVQLRMAHYPNAIADCASAYKLDAKLVQALYAGGLAKLKNGDVSGGNADTAAAKDAAPGIAESFTRMGVTP